MILDYYLTAVKLIVSLETAAEFVLIKIDVFVVSN